MKTRMYHPTISVPLVYGPKDCDIFERDFRYIEDLILRQMETGISPSGISFEYLTGCKWQPYWERPSKPSPTRQHKN